MRAKIAHKLGTIRKLEGLSSRAWRRLKRTYNAIPRPLRHDLLNRWIAHRFELMRRKGS